jgi:hypothetical protein
MNTRVIQVLVILIISLAILAFIRGGLDFDIRSIVPFMSGGEITLFDWGGLVLLILVVWGIFRVRRLGSKD